MHSNSSNKEIKHRATVVQVAAHTVDVEVVATGACASCLAKNSCGTVENQNKLISITTDNASFYQIGEEVEVSMEQNMGIKAVLWAYIAPFLLVFTLLLSLLQSGCGELMAGLTSLGTLIVYYVILYLFRNKIAKEINFKLHKIND